MRAGDLDRAGAEILIRVFVGDDRDQATLILWPDGDLAIGPDQRRVALIRGVHRDRAVAQHRFGARRGDGDIVALFAEGDVPVFISFQILIGRTAGQGVLEMPHMACDLDILDFKIRDRRLEMRVPVDQPLAAIDEPLVEHLDKDLDDGVMEIRRHAVAVGIAGGAAHGKGLTRPIGGGAEPFQLTDDGAARLDLLLPDPFDKGLAPHLAARRFPIGGHLAFRHQLRGDARVIGARLPERVVPLHALPADQDVLQRVVEGVADVQRSGHVRWRDHDREGLVPRGIRTCLEGAALLPGAIDAILGLGRFEGLVHRHDCSAFDWCPLGPRRE